MRRALELMAALVPGLLLAAAAHAACYTVIDARGAMVSQTSTPPVDMSQPLHQTGPARYGQGAQLVFGVADAPCGPAAEPMDSAPVRQHDRRLPSEPDRR